MKKYWAKFVKKSLRQSSLLYAMYVFTLLLKLFTDAFDEGMTQRGNDYHARR